MTEQAITDAVLRHSLEILRLAAGQQAQVETVMDELATDLRLLLQSADISETGKRKIEALLSEADNIIAIAHKRAGASVDTYGLAVMVAEKTQEIIQDVIPVDIRLPTDATLLSLGNDVLIEGAPSSAWWAKQAGDVAFRFAAQVRQGIINGETQERIVQRIVGRRGEPGIMDVARRNARALVHSSVMSAANRARLETFRKNARVIKGVRWLATFDGHTCNRCAALDGQAWNLDGEKLAGTKVNFMAPPIHFGDRCVLSPIPKTFREIGLNIDEPADTSQRASKDGPINGKTTFDEFLARQSDAFVEATLGKERAALYRAGKISVRDLVSGTGRELSLNELRTR